jgi:hypothetical protein
MKNESPYEINACVTRDVLNVAVQVVLTGNIVCNPNIANNGRINIKYVTGDLIYLKNNN